MIWAKEETLPRAEIESIQLARLQDTVQRNWDYVAPYRTKMQEAGVRPEQIKTLADLARLPFTNKQDLRDNYPFGLFAVEQNEILRLHASSGTTGKPTVVGYTKRDLEVWAESVARTDVMAGMTPDDVVQICFGYGMFTGALGHHYGIEKVGVVVVPTSSGNTKKQLLFMKDFRTSAVIATPSYALRIGEVAAEIGIDVQRDLFVKKLIVGSELLTEAMRGEMHKMWGDKVLVTSNYGMSELNGPGVSGECEYMNGMHVCEDLFIPEIINPRTGEVLPEGEKGELVITCIYKEALPLIRYRTHDITSLNYDPCKCGRTTCRMANLDGRTDDMIKVRGVNVFPSQIEDVLLGFEELAPHYQINVTREGVSDRLEVEVEFIADKMSDSWQDFAALEIAVKQQLYVVLGLDAGVKMKAPGSLPRFEGKAKRVNDLRQL